MPDIDFDLGDNAPQVTNAVDNIEDALADAMDEPIGDGPPQTQEQAPMVDADGSQTEATQTGEPQAELPPAENTNVDADQ